jgi:tRNA (adenine57-N1/adenine58-N1)-methyltransferase
MIDRARENIDVMLPGYANFTLKLGDVAEGIDERDVDRIVLDLPEPWHVVPHAAESLRPGGIFLSFLPTVLQVHEFTLALRAHGSFELIETFELIMRSWSVGNRSIRPDHRMVAHTGFITTARKCQPKPQDETEDAEVTGEASPAPEANQ